MKWDKKLAAVIDHTILDPSRPRRDIEQGCEDAGTYGFAALVVQPYYVPLAAEKLRGTGVRVCSVVSFPFGAHAPGAKVLEAERLLADGAEELDMVMNISAFLSDDCTLVRRDIRNVAARCKGHAILKVIIETACLDPEQIKLAASLGVEEGADFIKTSTGYARGGASGRGQKGGGATTEAVRIIRSATGGSVGIKASGGIRTREFARSLLDAGATRLGCSASIDVIRF